MIQDLEHEVIREMALATQRDLVVHEHSDTVNTEYIVLKMLGELVKETKVAEVKAGV